jgi:hypothetical protein
VPDSPGRQAQPDLRFAEVIFLPHLITDGILPPRAADSQGQESGHFGKGHEVEKLKVPTGALAAVRRWQPIVANRQQ